MAVPSGLFIPAILIGAPFGRLLGELLKSYDPITYNDPGAFALLAAAASISGITRLTITLTVIMYETTNRVDVSIELMLVIIISKIVADRFNISLYDMHIELKGVPFVETFPHRGAEHKIATEIMDQKFILDKKVICFNMIETVHNIIKILKSNSHNGFPIVEYKNNK